ncbi:zinc ribbon domain-containing protein [Nonomuraea sp. NPDC049709]|uniref:zinc ribbon domain-containing protein n=1 Tax=Nonomuraea sp. NPDC049709 TaxID=3154736 RepID=UPI00343DE66C
MGATRGAGGAEGSGRIVTINPAYASQRCSACGIVDREARESQARFRCWSCGYAGNAGVNVARNTRQGMPLPRGPAHRWAGRSTANLSPSARRTRSGAVQTPAGNGLSARPCGGHRVVRRRR